MAVFYHITTKDAWEKAKQIGFYEHPSLQAEGFIHCSQEHQIAGVLERYFEGEKNLIKLVIDADKLTSRHVFDWSPTVEDTFPHIYGPLNVDAVTDVVAI
jgi:uncharacterized protein (DUF952 family)